MTQILPALLLTLPLPAAAVALPQTSPAQAPGWQLVERISLEVPANIPHFYAGTSFLLRDGRLVLQNSAGGELLLFGPDGKVQERRLPPAPGEVWDRKVYRSGVLGNCWDALWIAPNTFERAERLWGGRRFFAFGSESERAGAPEYVELSGRIVAAREGGWWVAEKHQVRALDMNFQPVGWVHGADGDPIQFDRISDLDLATDGTLAILESRSIAPGCLGPAPPIIPDIVYLADPSGMVRNSIPLPFGCNQQISDIEYDGKRLIVGGYGPVLVEGERRLAAMISLERTRATPLIATDRTGEDPIPGVRLSFGVESLFLCDGGKTLKLLDWKNRRLLVCQWR